MNNMYPSAQAALLPHTLPPDDVTVHLQAAPVRLVSVAEKEALLRAGVSYGELLTPEAAPQPAQQEAYAAALTRNGERLGRLLAALTATVLREYGRPVMVSLARGGTPVGCAMRRLARRWGVDLPHHTLSIIRGVGIDRAALEQIRAAHPDGQLIFVDGWTGKGSILGTLRHSLPTHIAPILAVLSDPAGVATHAATFDDLLLPHAALNATVCGLLSRTFLPQAGGLHGARIETELREWDITADYLAALGSLSAPFGPETLPDAGYIDAGHRPERPFEAVLKYAAALGVGNPHHVKPSVGEATRVFLRRQPQRLILRDSSHPDTLHLQLMAHQRSVPVTIWPELPYLAAATIAGGAE